MTVISLTSIKQEWLDFLRNSDVLTDAERGVTDAADTGTFTADSTHLIAVSNIKNIVDITVAATPLVYGTDYTYDVDFDDSGIIKTKITFTSPQTGAYTINYQFGTDKIYPDFPRPDLKLSEFPRLGFGLVSVPTEAGGFGAVNVSKVGITTIYYAKKTDDIDTRIDAIRTAIFNARKDFVFLGHPVQLIAIGPVLKSPRDVGKDKILQQNIDVEGLFNYEK